MALRENFEQSRLQDPLGSELGLSDSNEQRRLCFEDVEGVEVVCKIKEGRRESGNYS